MLENVSPSRCLKVGSHLPFVFQHQGLRADLTLSKQSGEQRGAGKYLHIHRSTRHTITCFELFHIFLHFIYTVIPTIPYSRTVIIICKHLELSQWAHRVMAGLHSFWSCPVTLLWPLLVLTRELSRTFKKGILTECTASNLEAVCSVTHSQL